MNRKPIYKLNNWSAYDLDRGGFARPTPDGNLIFHGSVQGNPRFQDGDPIFTSRVKRTFKRSIVTLNSRYRLGKPAPAYTRWLQEQK